MSIGDRLREERERLGYSQAQFAALDGKSKRSQVDWEANVAAPNANYLTAIASQGADVAYVLTGLRLDPAMLESFRRGALATMQANVSDEERSELQRLHIETVRGHAHLNGVPSAVTLTARESALVDNYRHAGEAGQKALDVTGAALAQSKITKKIE